VDSTHLFKRALFIAIIGALPVVANAAPPAGGGHPGGGSHGGPMGGGRPAFGGRGGPGGGSMRNPGSWHGNPGSWHGNPGSWHGNPGSWHGNAGSWHGNAGSWHGHGDWHHHHNRFSFGFFPYWYPGWGYYDYGYPYYPYYGYDYPDYYYPDSGYYSGDNGSASFPALVQGALARRGYYDGQVDGIIGSGTRSAIREFQRDNGLTVTGRVDPQLVQALKLGRD
jgi:Putative peptidoglycan binding domain